MITACALYFTNFNKGIEDLVPNKYEDKWDAKTHKYFNIINEPLRVDIMKYL